MTYQISVDGIALEGGTTPDGSYPVLDSFWSLDGVVPPLDVDYGSGYYGMWYLTGRDVLRTPNSIIHLTGPIPS